MTATDLHRIATEIRTVDTVRARRYLEALENMIEEYGLSYTKKILPIQVGALLEEIISNLETIAKILDEKATQL